MRASADGVLVALSTFATFACIANTVWYYFYARSPLCLFLSRSRKGSIRRKMRPSYLYRSFRPCHFSHSSQTLFYLNTVRILPIISIRTLRTQIRCYFAAGFNFLLQLLTLQQRSDIMRRNKINYNF